MKGFGRDRRLIHYKPERSTVMYGEELDGTVNHHIAKTVCE
jgi:hypothetical protein